jgi:hypothetical protein
MGAATAQRGLYGRRLERRGHGFGRHELGVPPYAESCHIAVIGGYFISGHVPAKDISRLLAEHPNISGLAVPGMPIGPPGMEGPDAKPYSVLAIQKDGSYEVFSNHPA